MGAGMMSRNRYTGHSGGFSNGVLALESCICLCLQITTDGYTFLSK
jgi:hypothetical protein